MNIFHRIYYLPLLVMLITFINSLDPDQDRKSVGPDLDPNYLSFLIVFMKDLLIKVNHKSHGRLLIHILNFNHFCLIFASAAYEGCSNTNASSFITFFTYMLRQNGKRFYKCLYVTFKLAPDLKKNTVHLSRYSPSNEGHVSILINSMLRTYTSDIDKRIILR